MGGGDFFFKRRGLEKKRGVLPNKGVGIINKRRGSDVSWGLGTFSLK